MDNSDQHVASAEACQQAEAVCASPKAVAAALRMRAFSKEAAAAALLACKRCAHVPSDLDIKPGGPCAPAGCLTWTSNSTKLAPQAAACWKDLRVFSLYRRLPCLEGTPRMFMPILQQAACY